jgi:2'-5' RNA ligase
MAMNQLCLDFGPAYALPAAARKRSVKPHGLFIALQPPDDVKEEVKRIEKELRHTYGIAAPERAEELLHVSVAGIGGYDVIPRDVILLVRQIAKTVTCAPIELTFNAFMRFGGNANVLCGDGDKAEFDRLCLHFRIGLRKAGKKTRTGGQTPHMTLFYHPKAMPRIMLETPLSWVADEFVLIDSLIGKAKHEVLDRWPLAG